MATVARVILDHKDHEVHLENWLVIAVSTYPF